MERKIGEIFEYKGEWYQCIVGNGCENCAFNGRKCYIFTDNSDPIGECCADRRRDNKDVIFKKLEKVGEPFSCNYYGDARLVMMQEYQLFDSNVIYCNKTPPMYITDYKHKRIAIEIKVNKEDMGENDIESYDRFFSEGTVSNTEHLAKSNLKPFDLQKAKEGKPVCTRDGRKARIICFDKKCSDEQILIVLVDCGKEESIYFYTTDGKCIDDFSSFDLMMLPEKKEGWVNVYKREMNMSVRMNVMCLQELQYIKVKVKLSEI